MPALFKAPETRVVSWIKRLAQLLGLIALAALAALVFEHWRGERALRLWKEQMTAQGEILDPTKLWPTPSADAAAFSNQLVDALAQLPKGLDKYSGWVCGMDNEETGQVCRSSRMPIPLGLHRATLSTWSELNDALKEAEPSLRAIRQLMKNPPRAMQCEIPTRLEPGYVPNFIATRRGAQSLATATVNDLHEGNLAAALENLEALQGFVRLNADEPGLVSFMIRVAIMGLGSSAGWDALQEQGWTEPQLLRLQQTCESNDLLPMIPNVLVAERLARLHSMDWLGTHPYQAWAGFHSDILKAFGEKLSDYEGACWHRPWRQWVFHPVWSYAWRAQEEMHFLRYSQANLAILREAIRRHSWAYLNAQQATVRDNYRRPPADWRFYQSLPMLDQVIIGENPAERTKCPYPNFSRAWQITAQNLNSHEMMITVIALKRYQLHHGKMPGELAALVPAYLKVVPRDLVDGQPLRYQLKADGSFVLYSIGEDAEDNGGDPRPAETASPRHIEGFSSGRDWVWPQVAAPARPPKA